MIIVFNLIYRSLLVILLITSCSGGSSSISSYIEPIIPNPVTPEFVQCDNYQGETENLIWIEDFNNDLNLLDDTTWTSIEGN